MRLAYVADTLNLVYLNCTNGLDDDTWAGLWDQQMHISGHFIFNPFAPGDFAEKRVLKLVEWFSGHCRAIKS